MNNFGRCDAGVHQRCYGITDIEGEFTCDTCKLPEKKRESVSCVICCKPIFKEGGMLRCISRKRYAHVFCLAALAGEGVFFGDFYRMKILKGLDDEEALNECCFCSVGRGAMTGGRTIRCADMCAKRFHPLCGWLRGLKCELKEEVDLVGGDEVLLEKEYNECFSIRLLMYCEQHASPKEHLREVRRAKLYNKTVAGKEGVKAMRLSKSEY